MLDFGGGDAVILDAADILTHRIDVVGFEINDSMDYILQTISEDQKQLGILVSTGKRDFPIMVDTKEVRKAD